MRRYTCAHVFVWALVIAFSFGTALSSMELAVLAQGPGTPQGSQSTVTTNFGVGPSLQIANTSLAATVGSDLTVRFNVTAYQPGTLHWLVFNGTGQTAFLFLLQNEGGAVLPNGVTAAYPDGTSSNGNRSNVAVILDFASSTAGKTVPLQLVVWEAPQSNPQQPIGVAETLTVTVGPAHQTSSMPLELMGAVGVVALIVVIMVGLLYRKKAAHTTRPTGDVGRLQMARLLHPRQDTVGMVTNGRQASHVEDAA